MVLESTLVFARFDTLHDGCGDSCDLRKRIHTRKTAPVLRNLGSIGIDAHGAMFAALSVQNPIGHDDPDDPYDGNENNGPRGRTRDDDGADDHGKNDRHPGNQINKWLENTAWTMANDDERTIGNDGAACVVKERLAFRHEILAHREVFRGEKRGPDRGPFAWDARFRRRDRW